MNKYCIQGGGSENTYPSYFLLQTWDNLVICPKADVLDDNNIIIQE